MQRVFGIGLNKTGTTSLTRALEVLGYSTLHNDNDVEEAIRRAHREQVPLLTYAREADAYLDIRAVEMWFDLLDQQYPGSRFILTTRNLDSWLRSREKHVHRNQARVESGEYDGRWLSVDLDGWRREWHEHHDRVRSYFEGRANLLELDISAGDGWDLLAPFLGVTVPNQPFPWLQRATARTPFERLSRRVRGLLARNTAR